MSTLTDMRAAASPVRFGVIGCGTAAVPVCAALDASPLATLVAVQDVNPAMAHDLAERHHVPALDTVDQLLAVAEVEAVYIAVPHHLLAGLATQALRAGKHVLVEKPMAITLADADALIALAQANGRTLDVFYEMRQITAYAQARELVQTGAIGEVIGVRLQTLIDKRLDYWQVGYAGRSNHPWRGQKALAGGGVVLMNTSHALDALRYVTGLEVVSVAGEIATQVAAVEVEDLAVATLKLSNGALGSLIAGAHIAGARRAEGFDVYGVRGQICLPDPYGADPVRVFLREAWRDLPADAWHALPVVPGAPYQRAVEAFAQTVRQAPPTTAGAQSARQTLATVLALYQSAAVQHPQPVPTGKVTYA